MVNWILEDGVFGSPVSAIVEEVQSQNHQAKVIDYTNGVVNYKNFFPKDECILFYGSHYIAEQIVGSATQPSLNWAPGILGTIKHYYCTQYYPYLKPWLLNHQYLIVPLVELLKRLEQRDSEVGKILGDNTRLFVRPDSPTKTFTGSIFPCSQLRDLQKVMSSYYSDEMLVVVAPEQKILAEWRVVVVEGEVLTASQYKQNHNISLKRGLPDAVHHLAKEVVGYGWEPDLIWILDLCWAKDRAYVLEINLFSCAAFYNCDLQLIVKEASRIAQEVWHKTHVG